MNQLVRYLLVLCAFWVTVNVYGQAGIPTQSQTTAANTTTDSLAHPLQTDSIIVAQQQWTMVYPAEQAPFRFAEVVNDHLVVHNVEDMSFAHYLDTHDLVKTKVQHEPGQVKFLRDNWILFMVLLIILGVGLVRLFFYADVKMIFQSYFQDRVLMTFSKEDNILTSWPFVFLYLLFCLSVGMLLFLFYIHISQHFEEASFANYLKISGVILVLFLVKILVVRFMGFLFEISRITKEYVTILYLIYFNFLFFSLPVLLMAALAKSSFIVPLLVFAAAMAVLIFLYRFFRMTLEIITRAKFSVFYIILYLCALEIAPVLILIRLLG